MCLFPENPKANPAMMVPLLLLRAIRLAKKLKFLLEFRPWMHSVKYFGEKILDLQMGIILLIWILVFICISWQMWAFCPIGE